MNRLHERGFKAGLLSLNTLWPINYDILKRFSMKSSLIIVPEMNLGQIVYDVYQVKDRMNVYPYNKVGGGIPIYPDEIVKYAEEVYRR